jgi:diguanylate cyclase (GGDEF)-like protein/PAS domain S-box-containing protein
VQPNDEEVPGPFGEGSPGIGQLLDALFLNSPETIVIVAEDGSIRYATAGLAMLLGHDASGAINQSIFSYVHPADVEAAAQLFDRRLDFQGADLGHEVRIRHSSGAWIPLIVTAIVLPGIEIGAVAITIRTPDASTGIEHSLRQRVAVGEYCNTLSTGIMALSEPGDVIERITVALSELALLTGADTVDMLLEHRDRSVIERHARWAIPEFRVGSDGPSTTSIPDGATDVQTLLTRDVLTYQPDRLSAMSIFDEAVQAKPVSLLSSPLVSGGQRGVLRLMRGKPGPDWTDADAELVRNVAVIFGRALRTAQSERLLALTYHEGPLGFTIRTWDGNLIDCNQQFLDLYQFEREDVEGRPTSDFFTPEQLQEAHNQLDRLRRGEVERLRNNIEVVRGDGSTVWARTNTVPLQVPGSSDQLVLTSFENVTETYTQRLELEHAATHDALTGVANRSALTEFIHHLFERDLEYPPMLVLDLDHFKTVNDSHGHAVGDEVLRIVAQRIRSEMRSVDLVARLGGDEFAVVIPRLDADGAHHIARRLVSAIGAPMHVDGRSLVQTVSVGGVLGAGVLNETDLLVRADRALYVAKGQGRNSYMFFDRTLHDEVLRRVALEGELRVAIEQSQLAVNFQPEFSASDGSIVGVEALLRWDHPDRGRVSAEEFISVAEQSGAIDELGEYVVDEACRSFVEITEQLGDDSLILRVNISAREFARPQLAETVSAALQASGLDPSRLCLEMTETTLMDAPEVALETFARLQTIGVKSAIDDFGTGYSSLSYLKQFPVDCVKIDRTFVEDIVTDSNSRAIVEAILRLAEAMGLESVAEGVESHEQLKILRELGCDRAQGFLVAGALPPDELFAFLADQRQLSDPALSTR